MSRGRPTRGAGDWRVVHQVASWCLAHPDEALLARLPMLRGALAEQPQSPPVTALLGMLDHLAATPLPQLQRDYVVVFDLDRKHALHLSYWTDGDTRRRGEVLARFKQRYRDSGFVCDTGGELPDHLPMVLEFAAVADPVGGVALLQEYRASLELIRLALLECGTPYAAVLTAVCDTLPGPSPVDRAGAMRLADVGPPTESVGLEPFDPRLLPLAGATAGGGGSPGPGTPGRPVELGRR